MKTFCVSYNLLEMRHEYLVDAENEYDAVQKVLRSVHTPSFFSGFTIERYFEEWN